jgi:3-methyladenine DNA glycosylase AlkD
LALAEEKEDHLKAAIAWSLGQIGRHTPEHSKAIALANVLPKLLEIYLKSDSSEDLQQKVVNN